MSEIEEVIEDIDPKTAAKIEKTEKNLEMDARYVGQSRIYDPSKDCRHPIFILGVGAIGTVAAIACGKMGSPKGITLVDFDDFEEHNVANQLCLEKDHLGMPKVDCIANLCKAMGHVGEIHPLERKLVGDKLNYVHSEPTNYVENPVIPAAPHVKGIVISTPDNMEARKDLWKMCLFNADVPYVIDARMAAQFLQIIVASPMSTGDIAHYKSRLIDDSEATLDPCGERGIIFTSLIAGGLIASIVRQIQMEKKPPREYKIDIARMEVTMTLVNGEIVTNREALAMAEVGDF